MPPSTDGPAVRILVVDDLASNARLLELALRRGGYINVATATDPKQVAALHRDNQYELILLDLQMPGMNGFEVMKELRANEGEHRVAILVMSADPSLMLAALEAGGNSFLSKPFVLAEVLARVKLMLQEGTATEPKNARS